MLVRGDQRLYVVKEHRVDVLDRRERAGAQLVHGVDPFGRRWFGLGLGLGTSQLGDIRLPDPGEVADVLLVQRLQDVPVRVAEPEPVAVQRDVPARDRRRQVGIGPEARHRGAARAVRRGRSAPGTAGVETVEAAGGHGGPDRVGEVVVHQCVQRLEPGLVDRVEPLTELIERRLVFLPPGTFAVAAVAPPAPATHGRPGVPERVDGVDHLFDDDHAAGAEQCRGRHDVRPHRLPKISAVQRRLVTSIGGAGAGPGNFRVRPAQVPVAERHGGARLQQLADLAQCPAVQIADRRRLVARFLDGLRERGSHRAPHTAAVSHHRGGVVNAEALLLERLHDVEKHPRRRLVQRLGGGGEPAFVLDDERLRVQALLLAEFEPGVQPGEVDSSCPVHGADHSRPAGPVALPVARLHGA